MSTDSGLVSSSVLHIRPELVECEPADPVAGYLAGASVSTQAVSDVYRGLSRLLRCRAGQICGVVVCVDGVSASEFEFFSIVRRLRPGIPLYAYGVSGAAGRVARAIEFGATAEVTDELLSGLATLAAHPPARPTAVSEPAVVAPSEAAVAGVAPKSADDSVGASGVDLGECADGSEIESGCKEELSSGDEDDHDDEDSPSSVRVPWLRDADRPVRRGPGVSSSVASGESREDDRPGRSSPSEPLLTDQELEALMGDDGAGVSPDLRISSGSDMADDVGDLP